MRIRMCANSFTQGVEYQLAIVVRTNFAGNNTYVIKAKDCAEVQLVYLLIVIPLELNYIRQPLVIWLVRMGIPVQNIPCGYFRGGWCIAAIKLRYTLEGFFPMRLYLLIFLIAVTEITMLWLHNRLQGFSSVP